MERSFHTVINTSRVNQASLLTTAAVPITAHRVPAIRPPTAHTIHWLWSALKVVYLMLWHDRNRRHTVLLHWRDFREQLMWNFSLPLLFFPWLALLAECEDGQSRLVNSSITTNDYNGMGFNVIEGLIEVCYNGSWLTVCYNESGEFTEGNMIAVDHTCQSMGYDGKREYCLSYWYSNYGKQ